MAESIMDTVWFSSFGIVVATIVTGCVLFIVNKIVSNAPTKESEDSSDEVPKKNEKDEIVKTVTKSKKGVVEKRKDVKDQYTHAWLFSNLKGHSSEILDLDFSSNGKYLASCADDRSVMLWNSKTFSEKNHKSIRANVEYDHATRVKWSPDSKAFIVCLANGNTVQVYRVGKKKDGTLGNIEGILKFPEHHNAEIINIGIACNGNFIMSCSSDTTLVVWDLKGQILATIDTLHISNYFACVSPCGRFVASSGFTPDVRVWDVCFSKTGEFKEVKRAFELKGHSSGVYNFSFSNDSSRMVSVSKDGTWKLWDTNIEYQKGQDPYLLKSQNHSYNGHCLVTLSPDGRTVAVCSVSDVCIYSGITGDVQAKLGEIHSDPVRSLIFSPNGHYLVAAAGRHIRIFHNIPGYRNLILDLEEAKKKATNQTMKERLQCQLDEAKSSLKALEDLTKS